MNLEIALHRIAFTFLLTLAPAMAHAQMYKWVDENGHVQYSDLPPPAGVKSEKITNSKTPPSPASSSAQPGNPASRELDFKKRLLTAEEKQKEDEKKEKELQARRENCDIARAQVKTLEDGGRVVKYNKPGEREFMTDAEIESARGPARAKADEACKPQ